MFNDTIFLPEIHRIRLNRFNIPLKTPETFPSGENMDSRNIILLELIDDMDNIGTGCYEIPVDQDNKNGIEKIWHELCTVVVPNLFAFSQDLKNRTIWHIMEDILKTDEIPNRYLPCIENALWDFAAHRNFVTGVELLWRMFFNQGRVYFSSEDIDVMESTAKLPVPIKIHCQLEDPQLFSTIRARVDQNFAFFVIEFTEISDSTLALFKNLRKAFPEVVIDTKYSPHSPEQRLSADQVLAFYTNLEPIHPRSHQDIPLFNTFDHDHQIHFASKLQSAFAFRYSPENHRDITNWIQFARDIHRKIYLSLNPRTICLHHLMILFDRIDTHNGLYPHSPIEWFLETPVSQEFNIWVDLHLTKLPLLTSEHVVRSPSEYFAESIFTNPLEFRKGGFPGIDYRIGFYPDMVYRKKHIIMCQVWSARQEDYQKNRVNRPKKKEKKG